MSASAGRGEEKISYTNLQTCPNGNECYLQLPTRYKVPYRLPMSDGGLQTNPQRKTILGTLLELGKIKLGSKFRCLVFLDCWAPDAEINSTRKSSFLQFPKAFHQISGTLAMPLGTIANSCRKKPTWLRGTRRCGTVEGARMPKSWAL